MYPAFIAAFIISILLTVLIVLVIGRRGPWGSVWTFFIILFLATWTVAIYITPIGPVYWNIAWVPIIFGAIIFAIVLAVMTPKANEFRDRDIQQDDQAAEGKNEIYNFRRKPLARTSRASYFFWILIIVFVLAILMGMIKYSY